MRCSRCSSTIPDRSVVCPFCTAPQGGDPDADSQATILDAGVDSDDAPTSLDAGGRPSASARTPAADPAAGASPSSADARHHGRFLPGTTVAERYRIVGLLGRGGMGEVYRADDLKLGQQVALKFLPGRMVDDDADVQRLFDEVRMARKVAHPNVCRVWDIGETDGLHYVSMEYVDGEDLASLLRRIGRLPEDKAVEIARQLCAALAASHDEGVLHRDLKPANVMIDGRGRVKLTDFGLAAVAEVRAGTPVYMAPEQLAGTEVSVRSDLYSLGLVLHELFTGKRVFEADDLAELTRLHKSSLASSLSGTAQLDPAVDRIIHRCLESDPAKRPTSALAVAAGLPGADPLAAALAAGETPSPEMVAEAGGEGSLPVLAALPLLVVALAGALVVGMLQSSRSLIGWIPFDQPPVLLDARALEILAELGHDNSPRDSASGFSEDLGYLQWLRRQEPTSELMETVRTGRAAAVVYWWRGSPSVLVPAPSGGAGLSTTVRLNNPPATEPGMTALQLDTTGRLVWLDVVPAQLDAVGDASQPAVETDWASLFELMDLDLGDFDPVPPRWVPEHYADERAAWAGHFPENPQAVVRIEAAALDGRPVSLRRFGEHRPLEAPAAAASSGSGFRLASFAAATIVIGLVLLLATAIFGGIYVAQRNVRSGRGDIRGARRLGFAMAIALAGLWFFSEHTYSANDINAFVEMLIFVGAGGGLTWALYLAVEPFMRRHAPQGLIGWTRVLDGRLADPLVGRDLLLGIAAGTLGRVLEMAPHALAERASTAGNYVGLPATSLIDLFGSVVNAAAGAVFLALGFSFLYGLTFLAAGRRPWLTYGVWLFFMAVPGLLPGLTINGTRPGESWTTTAFWTLGWALWLFVLFRLGLLAFLALSTTSALLANALPTLDLSAWYAANTIAGLIVFASLALYAFWRCVDWKGGFAEAMSGD